ncbi:MAG: hypothetical protein PHZ03_06495, partial [Syntrophomonas sp.]|nr:hypothetical protein [Syntrophomonas sp.]
PATLPLLISGHRAYLARYCSRLNIAALNPDGANPLCFDAVPGKTTMQNETQIHCNAEGIVDQIQIGKDTNSAVLNFPGGFPNLLDLPENQRIRGYFDIYISSDKITGGQYRLEKIADQVHVELNQLEEWQPAGYPIGYRLLFIFVKIFRNWPANYSWEGTVELKEIPMMDGKWQHRLKNKVK